MRAQLLLRVRHVIQEGAFVEVVVWRVPNSVRGSAHRFKYSLAFVVGGACVLRYGNEAGKGDHRHVGDEETPYAFTTPERLIADFWRDVEERRPA